MSTELSEAPDTPRGVHFSGYMRHRSLTGCLTCRRRRVKCDDVRPACGVCRRLQLPCQGFEPRILFITPLISGSSDDLSSPSESRASNAEASKESRRMLFGGKLYPPPPQNTSRAVLTFRGADFERQRMISQITKPLSGLNLGSILDILEEQCPVDGETISQGPLGVFRHGPSDPKSSSSSFLGTIHDLDADFVIAPDEKVSPFLGFFDLEMHASTDSQFETALPDFIEYELPSDSCTPAWQPVDSNILSSNELDFSLPYMTRLPLQHQVPPPDDFEMKVPLDVKFLLDHFAGQYVDVVSLIQNKKSPWRILHLPSVLKTFGELVIWKCPNHFQIALFYAVLALSSFHLDRTTAKAKEKGYWWTVGNSHYSQAASELRKGLDGGHDRATKVKYKDVLMAILTMVTVCITSGNMEDARSYLLRAQDIVRRRGLPKANKSRKVRTLHSTFVFLRVIEDSTFPYPKSMQLPSPDAKRESSMRYPSFGLHTAESESIGQTIPPADLWHNLAEGEPEGDGGSAFRLVYGIPESLFVLMSHVSYLSQQIRHFKEFCPLASASQFHEIQTRVAIIEDALCNWEGKSDRLGEADSRRRVSADQWASTWSSTSLPDDLNIGGMRDQRQPCADATGVKEGHVSHMALAVHSALLIYFYRQVREVNPFVLQPFVKRVKEHLLACEIYKTTHAIASSSLVWPGFIAAVEANDDKDFRELIDWLKSCGDRFGLRNFDRAAEIATEIRQTKLGSSDRNKANWMDVLREKQAPLVCS
ncbi:uncharacterized protein PV06_04011 [Exophiala oligosperma]|uniref:Zn(2)-C6 fungal-type domain-containing protein n=1 Tax=Exophiala oligosperma TaxID=215243 RepID=A0A0D2DRN9_9EURO|nr:uncharacterized protein PV06_04011 [Exophiala oligosperma]KIW45638.1 hypothetical protein PV06_04011 [Exophiala oligosperma]